MSILNVNKINPVGGGSTITIAGIASVTSSVTAPSFVGAVTGNADTASGLSGNPSINTTGIITATTLNYTGNQNLSNRNLVINGEFRIAQRGSSSTSSGYHTVDRFQVNNSGTNEAPTQAQVDVASGTTPYSLGFRKALKVTNGNQTGGAGASDFIRTLYYIEAQDLANSGWNYKSSSSFITLSFWVKASVAQTYYTNFRTFDGTGKMYYFSYTLSADTWTKVTHTIPGHADISFDNDNGQGMYIQWYQFRGTNNTGTVTANQWNNLATSTLTPDQDSTWYTTNDATWEMTGVQLEVGPVATPFEHRSFGDELRRCQRYYHRITAGGQYGRFANGQCTGSTESQYFVQFPVTMREAPTFGYGGTIVGYTVDTVKTISGSITIGNANQNTGLLTATLSGLSGGNCVDLIANNDTTAYVEFIAEL